MHNKISGWIKAAGRHFWCGIAIVCKSWQGSLQEGKSFSGAESQSFASGDCTAEESSFAERNNEWQRPAWWCGTEACWERETGRLFVASFFAHSILNSDKLMAARFCYESVTSSCTGCFAADISSNRRIGPSSSP